MRIVGLFECDQSSGKGATSFRREYVQEGLRILYYTIVFCYDMIKHDVERRCLSPSFMHTQSHFHLDGIVLLQENRNQTLFIRK